MARKYSKSSGRKVGRAMRELKSGTLRSGRSRRRVTSRKQAIAIGLSEARREGARVPRKSARTNTRRRRLQECARLSHCLVITVGLGKRAANELSAAADGTVSGGVITLAAPLAAEREVAARCGESAEEAPSQPGP